METEHEPHLVKMRIADVHRGPAGGDQPRRHVIVLEEVGGSRRLLIPVGAFEAEALALHLAQVHTPRPSPITFMANLLGAVNARLQEVRVHGLANNRVFYAVVVIEGAAGTRSMDARPSDALALAAVTGALIHVEPAVLEAVKTFKQTSAETLPDTMEDASHIAVDITARWPGYKMPRPKAPGEPA
jgi:bifunctional DNase/RNase